jgi:hypothetical protein
MKGENMKNERLIVAAIITLASAMIDLTYKEYPKRAECDFQKMAYDRFTFYLQKLEEQKKP